MYFCMFYGMYVMWSASLFRSLGCATNFCHLRSLEGGSNNGAIKYGPKSDGPFSRPLTQAQTKGSKETTSTDFFTSLKHVIATIAVFEKTNQCG